MANEINILTLLTIKYMQIKTMRHILLLFSLPDTWEASVLLYLTKIIICFKRL